jgi:hypothetical protein
LNFNSEEEAKESPLNKNVLNLPYTDSENEEQQFETRYEDSVFMDIYTASYKNLPSPTPRKKQEPQIANALSSKQVKQNKSKEIKKLKN